MAEKKQSKRPSVVGRKVKIAKEPAAAAAPFQAKGADSTGSAAVGASAPVKPQAASAKVKLQAAPAPVKARPSVAGKPIAAAPKMQAPGAKAPSSAPANPSVSVKQPSASSVSAGSSSQPAASRPSVAGKAVASAPKGSSSVESASVSERTGTPRVSKKGGKRRISRKFVVVAVSVVAVLLVALAVLSWNQWLRYDDSADIQGTWVAQDTGASITITSSEVRLTSDVSYTYELDTFHKTISFGFGKYTGGGTYVFSPERDVLTITEDEADADGGKAVTTLVKRS